ncbi:MAG TPA: proteasome accessory factor PafA2 family protein [Candidatus Udaeobacter sp.]|jgi:proteasome accessory factor A|nr:proteasome accessory factor PafA2 family protein [Candidatus Udaeobacter sp.]
MDRIVGIETEYGCLLSEDEPHGNSELWPAKVKNYLFRNAEAGTIDLHYRDYEEPPGNGGFLLNGGRLYLDMGHIEYASPECLHLHDLVAYELAGDDLLQSALIALDAHDRVSFIKNNVDHHTGATFGCHENYLMKREAQFTPPILGTLLTFLATRQIFTGAGRVGQSNPLAFDFEPPQPETQVTFQLSQRADHIVNDIYQWVQFNRAIINARDEPLADYRKYRRLHLLIGDSNMSPYATALKIGTTACVLSLLEDGRLPRNLVLADAVQSTRDISRDPTHQWIVHLENGKTVGALDVQWEFYRLAQKHLRNSSAETNWLLENWAFVLEVIRNNQQALIGGVDWITKKWLLEAFVESEGLSWDDPWLQSIDLEYHNIDSSRGLFFAVKPGKRIAEWNNNVRRSNAVHVPPANTRASGRARAVSFFRNCDSPYVINWDSIACDNRDFLVMGDPFQTYNEEVERFLAKPRVVDVAIEDVNS